MKYIGDILYNLPVHFFPLWKMSELLHDKSNKMTSSRSEYSDKPGHPPYLIPVITVRMKKPWVLIATHWAHSEDWSDWMDAQFDLSLRWVHRSFCLFCHASAQMVLMYTAIFSFSNTDKLCSIILNYAFWNIWHVKIYLQWPIIYGKYGLGWQWPMLQNTLTVAEWANLWEVCISTEELQNNVLLND